MPPAGPGRARVGSLSRGPVIFKKCLLSTEYQVGIQMTPSWIRRLWPVTGSRLLLAAQATRAGRLPVARRVPATAADSDRGGSGGTVTVPIRVNMMAVWHDRPPQGDTGDSNSGI